MSQNSDNEEIWTGNKVRKQFIDYFMGLDHTFYKSSPVVPINDPTLLFSNAGMNQFKSIFSGNLEKNSELSKLKRVANSQKCIRAGGKHNDLDDVGKDVYHHTFFEMLGSWSFGDYFKEDAIYWAYNLLTRVYNIPSERLYATYFNGDPRIPTCPPDEEAKRIWLKYLPEERVIGCGSKENFWEMADTGPCGPCSEIHYDRIGNRDASMLVNKDDPNVIEIWNLVFMQYYRELDGSLTPLPNKCVDTGLGLERLVSVLQNKDSNYDTDLFTPIFDQINHILNLNNNGNKIPKYSGKVGINEDPLMIDMSYRVIADHIRTLTIAIADGAIPSNEGRGYVLRRILRRAIRYGSQYLNAGINGEPWLYKLTESVSLTLGGYYSEINKSIDKIKSVILDEERQFSKTLFKGTERFNKVVNKLMLSLKDKNELLIFPASEAFLLYSTYGFPMDLTELMAKEKGIEFDHVGFQKCMDEHHLASEGRNNKSNSDELVLKPDIQSILYHKYNLKETDDSYKYYQGDKLIDFESKLVAIYDGHELINEINADKNDSNSKLSDEETTYGLVFDKTIFYSESGGQVSDIGYIKFIYNNQESIFNVLDCKKYGKYVLHIGMLIKGNVTTNSELVSKLSVNHSRRELIKKNHTATHLLNYSLRVVLGEETDQRGSVVDSNKLRFDFSHNKPLNTEQIDEIENIINKEFISNKLNVYTNIIDLEVARKIPGVRAIFGESYPNPVRVISVGIDGDQLSVSIENNDNIRLSKTSIEFCGGTHVNNTGDIQSFSILSEEGIAKGVRRIVAVTDEQSEIAINNYVELNKEVSELHKLQGPELESEISRLKSKLEDLKLIPLNNKKELLNVISENYKRVLLELKEKQKERLNMAKKLAVKLEHDISGNDNLKYIILNIKEINGDSKSLDLIAQHLTSKFQSVPIMLFTSGTFNDNGVSAISVVPKTLSEKLPCNIWLKSTLDISFGKCGGSEIRSVGSSRSGSDKIDEMIAFSINAVLNVDNQNK
ncbi:alanyl-tRNA synthetase (with domain) [Cryptosporidium bovis]|uniref:alanyl-tRNA synthetase (with domain) n=1 Tax=Cryptosporidium bovis TaxID=310047 RepID=UPI00351A5B27|nr:alanyl-tRNA synthetase (with domain) [Cryptosporidium bovis]